MTGGIKRINVVYKDINNPERTLLHIALQRSEANIPINFEIKRNSIVVGIEKKNGSKNVAAAKKIKSDGKKLIIQ